GENHEDYRALARRGPAQSRRLRADGRGPEPARDRHPRAAGIPARQRAHPGPIASRPRARRGARQPRPAPAGAAQPLHERDPGDAGGRRARGADAPGRAAAARAGGGPGAPLRRDRGGRHGGRDQRERPCEDLRGVLHIESRERRHRARPVGRPRNREGPRRLDRDRRPRAAAWHGVQGVLAGGGVSLDPAERARASILIVEDDAAMRDLLVEELGEAHFRVEAAPGGRSGVERVKQGGIDVVVSDLRMPDLDGFDLLRDIKATEPSPHIIVITAFGSIDTAIKAVKLGAHDYITKPFEMEALVLAVDKALSERGLPRAIARLPPP